MPSDNKKTEFDYNMKGMVNFLRVSNHVYMGSAKNNPSPFKHYHTYIKVLQPSHLCLVYLFNGISTSYELFHAKIRLISNC